MVSITKLFLFMFCLLISTSSFGETAKFGWKDGEWTNGQWSTDNRRQFNRRTHLDYVDKSTFKYHEGMVYWWSLSDYIKPTKDGFMSYKFYHEGDCENNRYRQLTMLAYREPIASGESHYKEVKGEWIVVETSPLNLMPFHELGKVCEYLSVDYYDELSW
jgi:hypothetical protein